MKEYILILVRAALILVCASLVGLGVNLISPKSLPWEYVPPKEVEVRGVKVPLIDEQAAFRFFGSDGTVFVDTRKKEDYSESHVQGAIFIDPGGKRGAVSRRCSLSSRRMLVSSCTATDPNAIWPNKSLTFWLSWGTRR